MSVDLLPAVLPFAKLRQEVACLMAEESTEEHAECIAKPLELSAG